MKFSGSRLPVSMEEQHGGYSAEIRGADPLWRALVFLSWLVSVFLGVVENFSWVGLQTRERFAVICVVVHFPCGSSLNLISFSCLVCAFMDGHVCKLGAHG